MSAIAVEMQPMVPQVAVAVAVPAAGGNQLPLDFMLGASPHIAIKQSVELFEAITGFETANKYKIVGVSSKDGKDGEKIGKAYENSDCCTRQLCGPQRGFEMRIRAEYPGPDQDVLSLQRPFKCCQSPCCCMLQEMTIIKLANEHEQDQRTLGMLQEVWTCLGSQMHVKDAMGNVLYNIVGPCIRCDGPCCTVTFELKQGVDGPVVGILQKQKGGIEQLFTDADTFGLQFPAGQACPVEHKALLLGAVFLIDFMFFEKSNDNKGAF